MASRHHDSRRAHFARRAAWGLVPIVVAVPVFIYGVPSTFAAPPKLTTAASANTTVGKTISDTATLSGESNPTGQIKFTLFGPDNANCTGTPAFTSTVVLSSGNASYPSGPFTAHAVGTYRFEAAYSGDAHNNPISAACNATGENVTVSAATPSIVVTPSPATTIGGSISATAVLSGGSTPTGTITFTSWGPNNPNCTGTPAFTSTTPSTGDGTYSSGEFTPTTAGTYRFVAKYGGNADNASVTSACGATVTVNPATPTIFGAVSGLSTITLGQSVAETATLSGGFNPTGTISFGLEGVGDTNCSGGPAASSSVAITSAGTYTSTPLTPTQPGSYRFVATYGGNPNNTSARSTCGVAGEDVTVAPVVPTVTIGLSPSSVTWADEQVERPTITVSPDLFGAAPTGTVTLSAGSKTLCTFTLPAGQSPCALSSTELPVGTTDLVAQYGGALNYASASSASTALTVNQAGTRTTLRLSRPVVVFGHEHVERLSVTVSSDTDTSTTAPGGVVTITEYGKRLCRVHLHSGSRTCRLARRELPANRYALQADYHGTKHYRASTSRIRRLKVIGVSN